MNKSEIYVPINNRKEAKQARAVLKALGIQPGNEFIKLRYLPEGGIYFNDLSGKWCNATSMTPDIRKEITLKQLIELLVSESNPIPVKIAVKVENEKEFKALMKYYDYLGYVCQSGDSPLDLEYFTQYPITFEDNFCRLSLNVNKEYQIIPFAEFAEEKRIKLPLITSEDGVDLFEGDEYWSAWREVDGQWTVNKYFLKNNKFSELPKRFSNEKSALSWIEAQKHKQFNLSGNCKGSIDHRSIIIEFPDSTKYRMSFDDVVILAGEIAKSRKECQKNG